MVYGGGRVGLMGRAADGCLDEGGEVLGVITRHLQDLEVGHDGVQELRVVETMHQRKAAMLEAADAAVALPGGWGTLEELAEAVTWSQLALHRMPVGLLDVDGYFHHLLAFIDHAHDRGFIGEGHRSLLHAHADEAELLRMLSA